MQSSARQAKSKLPKSSQAAPAKTASAPAAASLYLIATPIGNLEDITLRALRLLKTVSVIACEDTRTSRTLLAHYGVDTSLISYHEHNAHLMRPKILARLTSGQSVALISDAGTPLISDPGYKLVCACREQHIPVVPIPGACSVITALCASGLPTDQFHYLGFLPHKSKARTALLGAHTHTQSTLICFESPNRLQAALRDIEAVFGPSQQATIARELTKRFEEFRQGTVAELSAYYASFGAPRGEIIVLLAPREARTVDSDTVDTLLRKSLASLSLKEACAQVAAASGHAKRDIYQRALALKSEP